MDFTYLQNIMDLDLLLHDTLRPDDPDAWWKLEILAEVYGACLHRNDTEEEFASRIERLIVRILGADSSPLSILRDYALDRYLRSVYYHEYYQMARDGRRVSVKRFKLGQAQKLMDGSLQQWVRVVQQAGVDLEEYGALERTMSKKQPWYQALWFWTSMAESDSPGYSDLAYDQHPENWHFWWEHFGDSFAGDFWDMIDHPERTMPGAWNDEPWEDYNLYPDAQNTAHMMSGSAPTTSLPASVRIKRREWGLK